MFVCSPAVCFFFCGAAIVLLTRMHRLITGPCSAENFVGVTMLNPVALAAAFRLPSSAQRGAQRPLANFTAQHCERVHNASSPTPGADSA